METPDVLSLIVALIALGLSALNFLQTRRHQAQTSWLPEISATEYIRIIGENEIQEVLAHIEVRNRGHKQIGVSDVWISFDELRPTRLVYDLHVEDARGVLPGGESVDVHFPRYRSEPLRDEEIAALGDTAAGADAVWATAKVKLGNGDTLQKRLVLPPPTAVEY